MNLFYTNDDVDMVVKGAIQIMDIVNVSVENDFCFGV